MIGDESEGGDCDEVICAITLLLEVTQQKSINSEVHWTSEDFSSPSC